MVGKTFNGVVYKINKVVKNTQKQESYMTIMKNRCRIVIYHEMCACA